MERPKPARLLPRSAPLAAALTLALAAPMLSLAQPNRAFRQPAPVVRRAPNPGGFNRGAGPRNQEHLQQWLNSHQNQPLAEQQRALEHEPGFSQLNPQAQQRMRDSLTRLNNMTPAQRDRAVARTEAMERLTPPQRQQVRGAMQQLGALPEDRRKAVARSFRTLRDMSPAQQQQWLTQNGTQFSPQERGTLSNLLQVAPMLPPATPAAQAPR